MRAIRSSPLLPIFLIVFIDLIGFGIIIPLLPLYAESFDASPTTIGVLLASYSLMQMVSTPYLGALSDKYGRRPVLIISQIGTLASFILLGMAHSLPMLFIARLLDGASGGNISTAQAYISDVTPEHNRAKAFGLIGAAFGIGFILGPALGGFLGRNGNYAAPAHAAAIISFISLILTILLLPESRPPERRTDVRKPRIFDVAGFREAIGIGQLGMLLIIFFVFNLAQAGFQSMFALFAQARLGFGVRETGYVLAYVGLLAVLLQGGAIGRIVRRWGERRTMRAGLLFAAVGLITSAWAPSWPLLLLTLAPLSIGLSMATPTLNSMLTKESPDGAYGRILGLSQSVAALARVLGPLAAGFVFDRIGVPAPFLFAAVLLGGGFLVTRGLKRRASTNPSPPLRHAS
ncbi:MAG: transporter, family, tetracycline resistance protein [Gemmatimonadales bacterium]|jgi:DHA1 family tetracycline resistance protein-like MFS transporter|nr:transporter, family, tetracycline resistance protein [Gemmatimonadales bacterium]